MKKVILSFTVMLFSVAAYSQDSYVPVTMTSDSTQEWFVNTNIRQNNDGYYRAWVKVVLVRNIANQRAKMAKQFGNNKYLKYSYTVALYTIDISERRTQCISITNYDKDDNVLDLDNGYYSTINWSYAAPGTMMDAIISFVENAESVQMQNDSIYTSVQVKASFPGGQGAWQRYLSSNLRETIPVDNGAPTGQYAVVVSFLVHQDGGISDVKIDSAPSPDYGMAAEAIRVIERSPEWNPAIQNGRQVTCRQKQKITFTVQGN